MVGEGVEWLYNEVMVDLGRSASDTGQLLDMPREEKMEKKKRRDQMRRIDADEALIVAIGLNVFTSYPAFRIIFIMALVLWYWMKIRSVERSIVTRERDIYNEQFEQGKRMAPTEIIDLHTEHQRKPMRYDLKQLEHRRNFLVDKFVVVNLFVIILIQLTFKG